MTGHETKAEWHERLLAEAREESAIAAGVGKGTIVAGGRVLDRFSDPTLSLRVSEAENGDRVAREMLCRVYRDALKAKRVSDLPLAVRIYIRQLPGFLDGKLPAARGGRPQGDHRSFSVALAVQVELARGLSLAKVTAMFRASGNVTAQAIKKARRKWRYTREMAVEMQLRCRQAKEAGLAELPAVNLAALATLEPRPMCKPPRHKLR